MSDFREDSLENLLLPPVSGSRPAGGVNYLGEIPSDGGENITMDGGFRFYPVKKVSKEYFDSMPRGHLNDLDVLINKDGANTGKSTIFRNSPYYNASVNEHVFILRGKPDRLDQEYLHYLLQLPSVKNTVSSKITGSAQPGLNSTFIKNFRVLIAPLPEQKKIASILTSVDEVIENTQKQIDKLQDLKKATMNELLTKGIGHTEFKDSELGRIPKSWEVKRLRDIASSDQYSIAGGPFGSDLTSKHYTENGVPVIRGTNLSDPSGKLYEQDFVYVSELKANELRRNLAKRGDFVFTQRGTMGQVAYIPYDSKFNSYVVSQSQMKLTPNTAIVDPQFLLFWFTSEYFLSCIEAETIATGLPHINLGILKSLPIKLPNLNEQRMLSEKMQGVKKLLEKKHEQLSSFMKLKKSLMHDLLTGKVRVQTH